jgi:hypothetical protein
MFKPDRVWADRLRSTYELVVPVVRRQICLGSREMAASPPEQPRVVVVAKLKGGKIT